MILEELFAASRDQKKGILLFVNGQTIAGVVIRFGEEDGMVELRSQQYSRMAVRMDRIDGAALS